MEQLDLGNSGAAGLYRFLPGSPLGAFIATAFGWYRRHAGLVQLQRQIGLSCVSGSDGDYHSTTATGGRLGGS